MSRIKKEDSENTVIKTIRMKTELADKIQQLADKDNRNFSNMAETLLIDAVKIKID